jgi:FtsH-binding integral membrane protein
MGVVVVLIILAQACAVVFSFTVPKDRRVVRWFYVPSLAIAWVGYLAYETFYIPRHCSGDCNIRVDLLLIYPYLAFVTVGAIAYFARRSA